MTKHTPGPWRFKTAANGDNGITAADCGYFAEAFADIRRPGENARNEALANARLIAAAPELDAAAAEAWQALAWIIAYDSEDKALATAMARIEAARHKAGTFDYDTMRREALAKAESAS